MSVLKWGNTGATKAHNPLSHGTKDDDKLTTPEGQVNSIKCGGNSAQMWKAGLKHEETSCSNLAVAVSVSGSSLSGHTLWAVMATRNQSLHVTMSGQKGRRKEDKDKVRLTEGQRKHYWEEDEGPTLQLPSLGTGHLRVGHRLWALSSTTINYCIWQRLNGRTPQRNWGKLSTVWDKNMIFVFMGTLEATLSLQQCTQHKYIPERNMSSSWKYNIMKCAQFRLWVANILTASL